MSPQANVNIYRTKACQQLITSESSPMFLTREKRDFIPSSCWCTHAIGMELAVYIGGNGVLRTDSIVHPMHRGSICLIPPDVVTCHIPDKGSTVEYVNFLFLESQLRVGDFALTELEGYRKLTAFLGEGSDRISPVFCLDNPLVNEIENMGREIIAQQIFRPPEWKHSCASMILYLLTRIFREYRQDKKSFATIENRIEQSVSYIERNCAENMSLATLARMLNMSPSSYSHHFKALRKVSPVEFIIRCRLRKALGMLMNNDDVNQTVKECGFGEVSYFSRLFKQRFGCCPSHFRRLSLQTQNQIISQWDKVGNGG